ncbi:MAG: DUF4855 domain-containing protein [Prevotella sp.]|jgi:hypothetical protein|nr:DUF4855 domain-containing protein [Prevotella sp.]
MKKYYILSIVSFALFLLILGSCKNSKPVVYNVPDTKSITDLALIYHTNVNRPRWTPDEMKYYLYRDNDGRAEWLFDGFLFLEIYAEKNGIKYDYGIANNDRIAPDKQIWEYLLSETFDVQRGPNALEILLDSLANKGQIPPYKRQVMFSIPNPQYGQTNWGEIGGKKLDFNKPEDRFEAACWYVDRILEEWEKQNYNYLGFGGFYWLHETIDGEPNNDGDLIKKVSDYLKTKNMDLCWIPYNWAEGVESWKDFGFTVTYQQPNYFFDKKSELWILERAINFAKEQDLGLEIEFDGRVLEDSDYMKRYYTYIEEFEKGGIWDNKPVAYYEGGDGWLKMGRSKDPEVQKAYNVLADIIIKRQGKFSKIIEK